MKYIMAALAIAACLFVLGCKSSPRYKELTFYGNSHLVNVAYQDAHWLQSRFGKPFYPAGISVEYTEGGRSWWANRTVRIRPGLSASATHANMRHDLAHELFAQHGVVQYGHPDIIFNGRRVKTIVPEWRD